MAGKAFFKNGSIGALYFRVKININQEFPVIKLH